MRSTSFRLEPSLSLAAKVLRWTASAIGLLLLASFAYGTIAQMWPLGTMLGVILALAVQIDAEAKAERAALPSGQNS